MSSSRICRSVLSAARSTAAPRFAHSTGTMSCMSATSLSTSVSSSQTLFTTSQRNFFNFRSDEPKAEQKTEQKAQQQQQQQQQQQSQSQEQPKAQEQKTQAEPQAKKTEQAQQQTTQSEQVKKPEQQTQQQPPKEGEQKAQPAESAHEQQIAEKNKKINDLTDTNLRLLAEMENVRRRAREDVDKANKYALSKFAKSLLDVADDLGRVLSNMPKEKTESKHMTVMQEGIQMTSDKLISVLKVAGVEKYESAGKKFDPNIHEVLFNYEDPSKESDTIGQVLKDGYMIHDRVLRPAQVGTIKNKAKST